MGKRMAQSPFTLLLLKRLTVPSKAPLTLRTLPSSSPFFITINQKPFSSAPPQLAAGSSTQEPPPKPSSLSARMSFVFDQIDQIEKQRQQQSVQYDDTLQRIRAWRQSKKDSRATQTEIQSNEQNPGSGVAENDAHSTESALSDSPESTESPDGDALRRIRAWRESKYGVNNENGRAEAEVGADSVTGLGELGRQKGKQVELVHPWPEWMELMERLVQQNYFDHKRRDEQKMVEDLGFDMSNVVEEDKDDAGIDFKDFKAVQTACLNFGKDRFDILRSLSRQDIQNLVGFGCPSADKKVVFSAKLLRKHVHLDEGDVCSSCSLRNSCERGYLLTNKEDEARTIDVMRVLFAYGFDSMNGVVNESVLKQKSVKTIVRKLLHQVVKLSAVPIDPNLPPPVIKKPPPKVKQPPPPPKKRVGRDDIEMKKGDWLCPKCDFMNFAKNTVCLQCDAKRPKRQLLPGEWECPECNFLNYRRNMACFHCDCKRPPDAFMESKIQEMQSGPRTRLDKAARRPEVSNAWNFDFDDDESDGADVAAFEYADSQAMGEGSPLDKQTHGGKFRGLDDDFDVADRTSRVHEGKYSDIDSSRHGMGFDDFDDEEDDIDSYEIDHRQNKPRHRGSSNNYSDNEVFSEPEDGEGFNDRSLAHQRKRFPSHSKSSKQVHKRVALSGSEGDELDFDSDEDLPVHPNWKSSHVADSKHRRRGASKGLSFGSDEDLDLDSDNDDDFGHFRSKGRKEETRSYGRGNFRRGSSDFEGGSFSGSEGAHSRRNGSRGSRFDSRRRGNDVSSRDDYNFRKDSRSRSNTKMDDRRNFQKDSRSRSFSKMDDRRKHSDDHFDRSYRGSRGDNRRFVEDDYGRQRMKLKGARQDGAFGNKRRGRPDEYSKGGDDFGEFRNSRRVIER